MPNTHTFRSVFWLARIGNRQVSRLVKLFQRQPDMTKPPKRACGKAASAFARRRSHLIELIENNFDTILAVSNRTRTVLNRFGFAADRIDVSYIGTQHGELFNDANLRASYKQGRPLRIAYLGYMRADKGFWFLLDALETMPAKYAAQIELVCAAHDTGKGGRERLENLKEKLHAVSYFDGYSQENIDTVLTNADIGIVPPLWEDNLPQVAIEIVARGIPILTSDTGGAQELGNNPDFTFPAGSAEALHAKLAQIIEGKLGLSDFWRNNLVPKTMKAHVKDLMRHYQPTNSAVKITDTAE